ncbi:MAG: hypothetical protein GX225_06510 [Clostridiales bacterium]|nr:hypothetical protein [Clostridiales bacterium]
MIEARELDILSKLLSDMAGVLNVTPGSVYSSKEADTLLVMQRRMSDCELKYELSIYNEIFAKEKGASIIDIVNSAVAFIKIKILVNAGAESFDAYTLRELIKEFRSQVARTNNIIRLSQANVMTAEPYQKEVIELTIRKNEAFIKAFEVEVAEVERKIARMPVVIEEVAEEDSEIEEKPVEEVRKPTFFEQVKGRITKAVEERKEKQVIDEFLREEEKKTSDTLCVEIPFYDDTLTFTEMLPCKDMSAYCLLKRKDNVYFGLCRNVSKTVYNNRDKSLIELTEITEEFIQFMAYDLLSGEYDLKEFSVQEKKSMQMYFNFVTSCFQKNMGNTVNVQEYMAFKSYYNRLVQTSFELEAKKHSDYYRALPLVEQYMAYMESYNMAFAENKKQLIKRVITADTLGILEDLGQIMDNHMVEKNARKKLEELQQKIRYFGEQDLFKEEPIAEEVMPPTFIKRAIMMTGEIDPTPESLDPSINFKATEYNDGQMVSVEDMQRIQIKIQFLNQNHVITDEALFATSNVRQAVYDYLCKRAFIKKIGLYVNEKDIFLFSSKNASLSVAVLTPEMRKVKRLNQGVQGQLVTFYEEQIKKIMIELSQ